MTNKYTWVQVDRPEFDYYWTKETGWTKKKIKEPIYICIKTQCE